MKTETKVRTGEVVADPVTPNKFAPAKANPFAAAATVNPFAAAATFTANPFAAAAAVNPFAEVAVVNKFAEANPFAEVAAVNPFAEVNKFTRNHPGLHHIQRVIHLIPLRNPQGDMLMLPVNEYEESFEEYYKYGSYVIGNCFDFDWAAESRSDMCHGGYGYEDDSDPDTCTEHNLYAMVARSERDTFQPCYCPCCDEVENLPGLIQQALKLRAKLAADPDRTVLHLDALDLHQIACLAGLERRPLPSEVVAAITATPASGLGGAALDYATWQVPERYGREAEQFAELVQEVHSETYVNIAPVETFLLYSKSLPADARRSDRPDLFRLTGEYTICEIRYTSDLTGKVIGGWRSLYLEPVKEETPEEG